MPDTNLTSRQYTDLQNMLKEQVGDLFARGLNGERLSLSEEATLLEIGAEFYGIEGINAVYFFNKKITANAQVAIDNFIKTLIAGLEPAVIPGLPQTTLTKGELDKINSIFTFMVGDVYTKWYNFAPLTEGESKQMDLAGWRLSGHNLYSFRALRENMGLNLGQ